MTRFICHVRSRCTVPINLCSSTGFFPLRLLLHRGFCTTSKLKKDTGDLGSNGATEGAADATSNFAADVLHRWYTHSV